MFQHLLILLLNHCPLIFDNWISESTHYFLYFFFSLSFFCISMLFHFFLESDIFLLESDIIIFFSSCFSVWYLSIFILFLYLNIRLCNKFFTYIRHFLSSFPIIYFFLSISFSVIHLLLAVSLLWFSEQAFHPIPFLFSFPIFFLRFHHEPIYLSVFSRFTALFFYHPLYYVLYDQKIGAIIFKEIHKRLILTKIIFNLLLIIN